MVLKKEFILNLEENKGCFPFLINVHSLYDSIDRHLVVFALSNYEAEEMAKFILRSKDVDFDFVSSHKIDIYDPYLRNIFSIVRFDENDKKNTYMVKD